jgi:hypothetical protein
LTIAAALSGCHTLEGACNGAACSLNLLAGSGGSSSCGNEAEAAAFVIVLAAGTVIGAAVGAVQDLQEFWVYLENQCEDGWPWDSSKGKSFRRGDLSRGGARP